MNQQLKMAPTVKLAGDETLTPPIFIDSKWCERTIVNDRAITTESTSIDEAEVLMVLRLRMGKRSQCFRVQPSRSDAGGRTRPSAKVICALAD